MSINQLSEEILVHIFSFLPLPDRRNCAMTCKRWEQASAAPALTRDLWFHVKGSDMDEAEIVVQRSCRQYKHLRLSKASMFHFNPLFWTGVGASLTKLELIECFWAPEVYYSILQECPNLESLTICSEKRLLTRLNFELPPWVILRRTEKAMRNLRHLHVNFFLTADMFWLLLVPMTNVETIALSRFDRKSDFLRRLSGILGEHRRITMLDLEASFLASEDCEEVWKICSPSVQEIRVRKIHLSPQACEAMAMCSKLRHLTLKTYLENEGLNGILQNVPELETLELCDEEQISELTQETLARVLELKKLRKFDLRLGRRRGEDVTWRDMTQFLHDLERIPTLERLKLDMDGFAVTETAFQNLISLPNLHTLALYNINWNAECVKVLSSPKHLEKLRIKHRLHYYHDFASDKKLADSMMNFKSDLRTKPETSSLMSLKLENDPWTDTDLESIAQNHDRLRALTLWNCSNITVAGLKKVLQREPLLEELDVRCPNRIEGTVFEAVAEMCHQLRSLRLPYSRRNPSAAELFRLRRPTVTLEYGDVPIDREERSFEDMYYDRFHDRFHDRFYDRWALGGRDPFFQRHAFHH